DLARGRLEAARAEHAEEGDGLEGGEEPEALAGGEPRHGLHDRAERLAAVAQDRPHVEPGGGNAPLAAPMLAVSARGGRKRRGRVVPSGRRIAALTLTRRRTSTSSTVSASVAASVAAEASRNSSGMPPSSAPVPAATARK